MLRKKLINSTIACESVSLSLLAFALFGLLTRLDTSISYNYWMTLVCISNGVVYYIIEIFREKY